MNTLSRDRNTLKRLVESYGKKDVLTFINHLNEEQTDSLYIDDIIYNQQYRRSRLVQDISPYLHDDSNEDTLINSIVLLWSGSDFDLKDEMVDDWSEDIAELLDILSEYKEVYALHLDASDKVIDRLRDGHEIINTGASGVGDDGYSVIEYDYDNCKLYAFVNSVDDNVSLYVGIN